MNSKHLALAAISIAGEVHERLRLEQPDGLPLHAGARRVAVKGALGRQRCAQLAGNLVNPPETRVVARVGIFRPGVA